MNARYSVLATLLALALAQPAQARDPVLKPPLDCDFETTCFIPRFVDVDPGPGQADFRCGDLTGDGHKGTDFAVATLADLHAGVPVYPSAPGTVRGLRDGEPDTGFSDETSAAVEGKECGNGVVISHGDGWETQYCHLKRGSIAVRIGQRVGLRTQLGEVGLSGQTTFPHVHLSLRKDAQVIDPFAPKADAKCGNAEGDGLWQTAPPYRPGGLITLGFWDAVPSYSAVKAGTVFAPTLPRDAAAMVVWAYAFGGREDDEMTLTIDGPLGEVVSETVVLDNAQPLYFRAIGRRTPDRGWPPGDYTARVALSRDGSVYDTREGTIPVGP